MTRKPQQTRSKATVQAIIDAGTISIARYGRENTTTRHIADIAGISVGSLYEYFENKEAVYDAILKQLLNELVVMIQPMIPDLAQRDIRDAIRTLLYAAKELLSKNDEQYLKVVRQTLNIDLKDYVGQLNQVLQELVMQHIFHNPEHMRLRHLSRMTYIFINGGFFTIVRQLSEPNPIISYEELVEGLADMVGHYVEREMQLVNES